ncbi:MAG: hypothetical protein DMG92_08860 [Acidobacteria bacterium]|nr:MAG: hypothetical protein DMG92_08860 [Acidobacteriota bacterium]
MYTCYNRSNLQVIHSLVVAEEGRKLIVFMGRIIPSYADTSIQRFAISIQPDNRGAGNWRPMF